MTKMTKINCVECGRCQELIWCKECHIRFFIECRKEMTELKEYWCNDCGCETDCVKYIMSKKEISKLVCVRCGVFIGNREWTLNCRGCYVHGDNCNNMYPGYSGDINMTKITKEKLERLIEINKEYNEYLNKMLDERNYYIEE